MAPTFSAIGLVVADMAATLAFYRTLGLNIPADADKEPHVDLELPGGLRLMWDTQDTIRSFNPDWAPPSGDPKVDLAFRCADPAEVDTVYATMTGAGFHGHKEPWDAFWGQRYAQLNDPDGTLIDLFAPLPAQQ